MKRRGGGTCRGERQGNTLVSPLQMTLPSITLPYSPPHPFQVPLFLLFSFRSFQGFLGVEGFGLARWGYGRCLPPPPLGNHGEGCFDAWGTTRGLCVSGVGFLCFPVFSFSAAERKSFAYKFFLVFQVLNFRFRYSNLFNHLPKS